MRADVVTVGEAMALFIAEEPGPLAGVQRFRRAAAGAELNVAIGLARLGFRVRYVSAVGADALGSGLLEVMRRDGLVADTVRVDARHPTGFMFKGLAGAGADPEIAYVRASSAASRLTPADVDAGAALRGARWLHLTGIAPALGPGMRDLVHALARAARAAGCGISFDPNLRPQLWPDRAAMAATLNAIAALADVVLPGLDEGRQLTGRDDAAAIAAYYLQHGARQVAVKLGPAGALAADRDGSVHVPGVPVARVVDTVGAGDGFAAGVVSALLDGLPFTAAVARGNAVGARVVQFPGDSDGLPTRAQLPAPV